MKKNIDENTTLSEVFPLIEGIDLNQVIAEAKNHYNVGEWWEITIDNFCDFCTGDFSALGIDKDKNKLTLFGFAVIMDFRSFAENFSDVVGKLIIPLTAEEKAVQSGLPELTMFEVMSGFVRRWFGCKTYEEASKYKLSEYLLARVEDYRSKIVERRMFENQKRKNKIK